MHIRMHRRAVIEDYDQPRTGPLERVIYAHIILIKVELKRRYNTSNTIDVIYLL